MKNFRLYFYSETPPRKPSRCLPRGLTGCCRTLKPTMSALLRALCVLLLLWVSRSSGCRVRIPPHDQVAQVARFVAHQCDWASVATVSTHRPVVGRPFSNVFSVSDGPEGSGTGVPYLYLTRMDISVQDLQVPAPRYYKYYRVQVLQGTSTTGYKYL